MRHAHECHISAVALCMLRRLQSPTSPACVWDVAIGREIRQHLCLRLWDPQTCPLRMASQNMLNQHQCAVHAAQIAEALHHLHARGIMHMDVKPDNIYTCGGVTYKLGDFGLATCRGASGHVQLQEGDSRCKAMSLVCNIWPLLQEQHS